MRRHLEHRHPALDQVRAVAGALGLAGGVGHGALPQVLRKAARYLALKVIAVTGGEKFLAGQRGSCSLHRLKAQVSALELTR